MQAIGIPKTLATKTDELKMGVVLWEELKTGNLLVNTKNGITPFYLACVRGHLDIVKWIHFIDNTQYKTKSKSCLPPLLVNLIQEPSKPF